ncbi:hypothetical protein [Aeromonas sp. FDAARGOS 1402]|uniref:hypothetical protein n=1 Tax=Aeromonas sp. FDAARGOS 1402 TaxID=2778051 RepID=UPI001C243612|nr:hypothetical protein [Aeromonas sp. FDAARGOS 1402]QWZ54144.1 hypothetical protein I6L32_20615 [Aeromonas sp. FDAARGOS 1402]
MYLTNFGEYFSFISLVLMFVYGCRKDNVVKVKKSLVSVFIIYITFSVFNIYEYGFLDSSKTLILLVFIIVAYSYPKQSLWVLFVFLLFTSIADILFISGYIKTTQIQFIFIYAVFFLAKNHGNEQSQKVNIFGISFLIFLEISQGVYFSSRSAAVFSLLFFIYIYVLPEKVKKKFIYWLVFTPFIYIGGMIFYYKFAESSGLPISLSNVERSSMIMWCFDNLLKYFFVGPGVDSFIYGVNDYKFAGIYGETPNDPHAVLMRVFITSGTFFSCLFFIFYVWPLRHLSLIDKINPYVYIIYLKIVLLLSLGTFNSTTRVIVGIGIGVLFNVIYTSKIRILKNESYRLDNNNSKL